MRFDGLPRLLVRKLREMQMNPRCSAVEWLASQYVPEYLTGSRPAMTPQAFRSYGHHAARNLAGRFVEDHRPGICKNHQIALMIFPRMTVRMLLQDDIPLLAFARYHEDGEGYGGYDFIDAPHIAKALGEAFVPVPKSVLETALDTRALELAIGKQRDIDDWNPKRIGDVFYNFWD